MRHVREARPGKHCAIGMGGVLSVALLCTATLLEYGSDAGSPGNENLATTPYALESIASDAQDLLRCYYSPAVAADGTPTKGTNACIDIKLKLRRADFCSSAGETRKLHFPIEDIPPYAHMLACIRSDSEMGVSTTVGVVKEGELAELEKSGHIVASLDVPITKILDYWTGSGSVLSLLPHVRNVWRFRNEFGKYFVLDGRCCEGLPSNTICTFTQPCE